MRPLGHPGFPIPATIRRHGYAVETVRDHYPHLTPERIRDRLRVSTFVSVERRYLFCEIPKAACTSMKLLLRRLEGAASLRTFCHGHHESRRDMFVHARENVPLPPLIELPEETQKHVLQSADFLRMVVVRNPYTRLVSAWRNKVMLCEPGYERVYLAVRGRPPELGAKRLITFPEFVDFVAGDDPRTCDAHWARQVDHAFLAAIRYNLIGRTESLSDFLTRFAAHLGRDGAFDAEASNVSPLQEPAGYDRELAARVYAIYRQDFAVLGYEADDWPAATADSQVDGARLLDEIVERNLVISELYRRLDRASADLGRLRPGVSEAGRPQLIVDAFAALRGYLSTRDGSRRRPWQFFKAASPPP